MVKNVAWWLCRRLGGNFESFRKQIIIYLICRPPRRSPRRDSSQGLVSSSSSSSSSSAVPFRVITHILLVDVGDCGQQQQTEGVGQQSVGELEVVEDECVSQ